MKINYKPSISRSGFTLTELLVVVIVVAFLAVGIINWIF